jgi:hypothetical protein
MKFVIAALFAGLSIEAVADELVIGRWCDRMAPGLSAIMQISADNSGSVGMRVSYSDGSGAEFALDELGAEVYAEPDNSWGERYRIVPATGELQLLDDDGLIRTASRLENTPRDGECR